ncbi:MAG: hypothetical protein RLZZ502_274 [Pseudomonadota bacterium]|jgi:phosphatidylglycerophosphatase A
MGSLYIMSLLFQHPANFIALGAGSGLLGIAPGTCGALLGWYLGRLSLPQADSPAGLSLLMLGVMIVLFFLLGAWACQIAGHRLGNADDGRIVIDEVWAMWLIILVVGDRLGLQIAGFVLFRIFDIYKPGPVAYFDQIKNSLGVMLDDLAAALLTLLCLALWIRF